MSFTPRKQDTSNRPYTPRVVPTPRAGLRKARISLIVDMGVQDREDYEEEDGTLKPQKPKPMVAVFADLPNDVVDYGEHIGKKQYRLLLNKSFKGEITGVVFEGSPQKDGQGNILLGPDGKWLPLALHPSNLLTKLAKACGEDDVIFSMDISKLLGKPFMAQVEVKKTPDKNGKLDTEGNPVVYTNVNFKGAVVLPLDDDDKPVTVGELEVEPKCITFDNATKEDIQFIRYNLRQQIKKARDYPGSAMQKAIEAWEAENEKEPQEGQDAAKKPAPAPAQSAKAAAAGKAKAEASAPAPFEDMDDDIPF